LRDDEVVTEEAGNMEENGGEAEQMRRVEEYPKTVLSQ
jgi:hypothetical protein